MLDVAKQKKVYDKLIQADIIEYLSNTKLNFDYFIFADVFIYIGDLSEVFSLIKSQNENPGKLVFTIEHNEQDGYHLLKTGRYSHSTSYIESLCKEFNYQISYFSKIDLRKDKGVFIKGGIYVLDYD